MRGFFRKKTNQTCLVVDPSTNKEDSSSSSEAVTVTPTTQQTTTVDEAITTTAPITKASGLKQNAVSLKNTVTPAVTTTRKLHGILKKSQSSDELRSTEPETTAATTTTEETEDPLRQRKQVQFEDPLQTADSKHSEDPLDRHRPRKQVQFNESLNQRSLQAANSKHLNTCWYEKRELKLIASYVEAYSNELAADTSSNEESYRRVLINVYASCRSSSCPTPSRYKYTNDCYESILDEKQKQDLKKCIANANNRCGLERLIAKSIKREADQRRAKMRETIMKRKNQETQGQDGGGDDRDAWDIMAQKLETLSRPSRLFALELGQAMSVR